MTPANPPPPPHQPNACVSSSVKQLLAIHLFSASTSTVQAGVLLLIHGEDNKPGVDMFDRERAFVEEILPSVRQKFPALKIVLEHITTKYAVDFVLSHDNTAATITPQHILFNRNALFQVSFASPKKHLRNVLIHKQEKPVVLAGFRWHKFISPYLFAAKKDIPTPKPCECQFASR